MADPVKRVYDLLRTQYPDEPPLFVGDTVYYMLLEYPRNPRFVVDTKIEEVQIVISHPVYSKNGSIWFNIDPLLPNGYECRYPRLPIEKGEDGWPIWDDLDMALLADPGVRLGNWFLWLDLPIGHAVSPYREATPWVDVALSAVTPFKGRRRHAKSALSKFINNGMRFIASTHKKPVEQMNFPKYRRWPERKIYWRRK
jgi:hypothetical protein